VSASFFCLGGAWVVYAEAFWLGVAGWRRCFLWIATPTHHTLPPRPSNFSPPPTHTRTPRQPFYHVLVDVRDWEFDAAQPPVAYAAQELLAAPELVDDGASWGEVRRWFGVGGGVG